MAQRQVIPNWVRRSFSVYRGKCRESRYCAIAYCHGQGSLVTIVTSYKKRPLFTAVFRLELRSTQALITRALGYPSSEIKGPGSKIGHSPSCSAEVKEVWRCTSSSHTYFLFEYLSTFCEVMVEVRQKMVLSLLRTGEEYGEVETYVIAYQKVKALPFAQFSHRDGAPGTISTEGRISLTPSPLCSCYGTMPGLLLIVRRIFPTSLTVSKTSSVFK